MEISGTAAVANTAIRHLGETREEDPGALFGGVATPDQVLSDELANLLEWLRSLEILAKGASRESPSFLTYPDRKALGDGGTDLLFKLAHRAQRFQPTTQTEVFECMSLPLARWILCQGGSNTNLVPLVNCVVALANRLLDLYQLDQLLQTLEEIQQAVDPTIRLGLDQQEPHRHWRILFINKGIIVTRTHRTRLMETAIGSLIEHLPEDGQAFFHDGVGQMEAIDYPERVHLMRKHHISLLWGQTLLH